MLKKDRLQRVAFLCCHCLRNLAFHRSGRQNTVYIFPQNEFWVTVDGNFLDICVLEWCKLFVDSKGKHSWKKVVSDQKSFFNGLKETLQITEVEFNTYIQEVRTYRDKYVAHLDDVTGGHFPRLEIIKNSVSYLLDYLREHEEHFLFPFSEKASIYFDNSLEEGKRVYQGIQPL